MPGQRGSDTSPETLDGVFLRVRPVSLLAQCCGTRVNQLVSPLWDDRDALRRGLPGLFLIGDLVQIALLRDDDRLHLAKRLMVDAAGIAVSVAASVRDDYDESAIPVFPGCALAIEAGARLGPAGLVVPAVNGVVFGTTRRLRGHQPRLGLMGWQVAAALGGMGLAAYGRRRRSAELERHRRELAARLQRAELEGRGDFTNGVDALIDEVQRVGVLIDLATEGRTSNPAGDWKALLGEEVRRDYAFLGDVLARYQAQVNTTPDLSNLLRFDFDAEAGTVVLGVDQADQLVERLGRVALHGRQRVTAEASRRGVTVHIDPHASVRGESVGGESTAAPVLTLHLPAAAGAPRLDFDPVPGGFAWSAIWLAVAGGRTREHVPRWASLGPAGLALAAMVGSHRAGRSQAGHVSRPAAVAFSAALAAASTVVQTRTMQNQRGAGDVSRYPFTLALRGFGMVSLLSLSDLREVERRLAAVAGGAISAIGWLLTPKPRSGREYVAEFVWPVQSVMLAGAIAAGINEDAARLGAEIRTLDDGAVDEARDRGRRRAVRFAEEYLAQARSTLQRDGVEIPPELRVECQRRLAMCEARLARIHRGMGTAAAPA